MKIKTLSLITFLLALSIIFCACSSKDIQKGITYSENTATIVLDENPTTGYTWGYSISDESIISLQGDTFFASESKAEGAGGTHQYIFQAKSEGGATITFELGQQWDGGEKGAETKKYSITVDQKGKITKAAEE